MRRGPKNAHLFRAWHVLQCLVERFLYILAHLGDDMVGPIECQAVPEHKPHICNELIDSVIWQTRWCLLHLGTAAELLLDGAEVHSVGDDIWIMGYAQSHEVNGIEERSGVLDLFEATDGGEGVFQLCRSYWPRPYAGRRDWGHEIAGRGSDEREVHRGLKEMEMKKGAN